MILDHIAERIRRAKVFVTDVETTGLSHRTDNSCGYVLTFGAAPDESFYLPVGHASNNLLDPGAARAMLRHEIGRRPDLRVVFFNAAFDLKFFSKDGIEFPGPIEDAMVNASLVDERQPSFSLEACCKFMGVKEKKGAFLYAHLAEKFRDEANRKQMANFHKLPGDDPLAVEYATGDGTSTWCLWAEQQKVLDAENLRRIWEIECRVIKVLHRMSSRGIRVDEERLEQVRRMVSARLNELRKEFPAGFNDLSAKSLMPMFEKAGHTDWPYTMPSKKFPEGQPSLNKAWLATNPLGKRLIKVRELRHLLDTFIEPLSGKHLYKGRVHADFNQTMGERFGTVTGRLSCSNPNMQQIPKRDMELGPIFRSVFVPDPGMIWASADFRQIEPSLLAHYGQVRVLLDGYLSDPPIDAHTAVAVAAFHYDPDEKTSENKARRECGKRMNQALLTGAGVNRMTELLYEYGADTTQAVQMINDYFEAMPEIRDFQKKAASVMRGRGYVISLLGRRARREEPKFIRDKDGSGYWQTFDYKAVNRLLQCGNADINKKALADVDEYYASQGDVTHIINDVHDDICHQFEPGNRDQLTEAIRLMEDYGPGKSVHVDVPMKVDVGEGNNWAVATYGEKIVKEAFAAFGEDYK